MTANIPFMNHINKFYILFFLLLISFSAALAQRRAPGYMGKRFVLKYDQGISWSLGSEAQPAPNLHYGLTADYTLTTTKSIGVDYSFMPRYYKDRIEPGYEYFTQNYFTHRLGIMTKLFRRKNGNLAPTGLFTQVTINFFFINSKQYNNVLDTKFNHLTFDIGPSVGGGKQYIVGRNLMISLDIRLTLPLIGIANGIGAEVGGGFYANNNLTEIQKLNREINREVRWSNAQANFLVMKIGFGGVL